MWKVVVAIFIGGLVLAVVLMSEPVKDKVDMATDNAKKAAKKIQTAVTNSSNSSKSKAELEKEGIRIEGTSASAAIANNERVDTINEFADSIAKADAAKKAAQLAAAKRLIAEEDAAAAIAATKTSNEKAQKTLDEQRSALEAELKAIDLKKSATAAKTELFEAEIEPFVGFEHAAC
jgi:hypothetical protein